jgi:hypothetical protein
MVGCLLEVTAGQPHLDADDPGLLLGCQVILAPTPGANHDPEPLKPANTEIHFLDPTQDPSGLLLLPGSVALPRFVHQAPA